MKLLEPIHRLFETWVDPFSRTGDLKPPALALKFFWFYVSQAKLPFLALLVLGGAVALVEAALFFYVGRLVDMLTIPDVVWTCRLFARLSDRQLDDAFRAAGYSDDERARYVAKVKSKIAEGLALAQ